MTPETCNSPDKTRSEPGTEEAQAENVALAPCPFCGSANVKLRTSKSEMSWVACVACGLDAPTETGQTEAEAVAYWNRRAAPALPQDVAAQIKWLRKEADQEAFRSVANFIRGIADTLAIQEAQITAQSSTIASAREVIEPSPGVVAIAAERRRQIEVEGWTPEHDDTHRDGEMAVAGACYALNTMNDCDGPQTRFVGAELWPWLDDWWKPSGDRIRDLEKAGALIAAEIDRLTRSEQKER